MQFVIDLIELSPEMAKTHFSRINLVGTDFNLSMVFLKINDVAIFTLPRLFNNAVLKYPTNKATGSSIFNTSFTHHSSPSCGRGPRL